MNYKIKQKYLTKHFDSSLINKKKKKMVKKKGFNQWGDDDFEDFDIKDEKL
jgi:hypothetical protein